MSLRVFISAGEASGDALAASLLAALKARVPGLEAFGMGGPRMRAEGFDAKKSSDEVSVIGLVEVLAHLPRLFRLRDELSALAISERPDVAVLVDVPDFNIRVAKRLKRAGIPVVFYVAPTVWAWRPGRVRRYRRWIDRLLVLFPFEVPLWAEAGVDVTCVGHPLVDEIPSPADTAPEPRVVALLPGSREGEIRRHLDIVLGAARRLVARGLAERFVLPVAPGLDPAWVRSIVARARMSHRVELITDPAPAARRAAIASSAVALVASGTATLETALVGRAQIIFYRVSWLTYLLGRLLMRVRHFGLPNIIAGREVAPELLQGQLTASALAERAAPLLEDGAAQRDAERAVLALRGRLPPAGAGARAAEAVLEVVPAGARAASG